ncbi:MAG: 4'-phosphopantetheinyl transferase superfamily protein [Bacteroidota bacterium]
MVHVYFIDVSAVDNATFCELLEQLPPEISKKVTEPHSQDEQRQRLCGKLLLAKLLRDLGSTATLADLKYNSYGKPYLEGAVGFNLSHSGKLATCTAGKGVSLGIDVEQQTEMDIVYLEDNFTAREWQLITSSANRLEAFYRLWARKEALTKAVGKGASILYMDIEVCEDVVYYDGTPYHFYDFSPREGYCGCVCMGKLIDEVTITELNLQDLK